MIFRKNRLEDRVRFQQTITQGKSLSLTLFKVFWLENQLDYSRFGIVLKKKIFPTSVFRNRAKRLIREAIRQNLSLFKSGFDIIVLVKEDFLANPQNNLRLLFVLFKKAKLLVKDNV